MPSKHETSHLSFVYIWLLNYALWFQRSTPAADYPARCLALQWKAVVLVLYARPVGHSDLCSAVSGVRAKQKDKMDSLRPCLSRGLCSLNTTGIKHDSYIGFKSCDKSHYPGWTPRLKLQAGGSGKEWVLWSPPFGEGHTALGAVLLLFHHSIAVVFSGLSALFCGMLHTQFLLL